MGRCPVAEDLLGVLVAGKAADEADFVRNLRLIEGFSQMQDVKNALLILNKSPGVNQPHAFAARWFFLQNIFRLNTGVMNNICPLSDNWIQFGYAFSDSP